jgi:AcrR family transcriptional regulator
MAPESPKRIDPRRLRTRRAILDAAGELLATRGVEGTTIADIATRANIAVGSFYTHFPSKDVLLLAISELALDEAFAQVEDDRTLSSPLERVFRVGDAYVKLALAEPAAFRALTIHAMEPDSPEREATVITERISVRARAILQLVRRDLQEAMDLGEIEPQPIDQAMLVILGAWNGVATLSARRDALAVGAPLAWTALDLVRTMLRAGLATPSLTPRSAR